jgi:hypothetical protein
MSLADIVILLAVIGIVSSIIYQMVKKKDEGMCANCSYNKSCTDDCTPKSR